MSICRRDHAGIHEGYAILLQRLPDPVGGGWQASATPVERVYAPHVLFAKGDSMHEAMANLADALQSNSWSPEGRIVRVDLSSSANTTKEA